MEIIHNSNTTHYDLKCDNVVIEESTNDDDISISRSGNSGICVKIADFGETK